MIQIKGPKNTCKIMLDNVEEEVITQIHHMMNSPAVQNENVVIMPDTHVGKGSVVGFTSTFSNKVIPNVVGVDIGCGIYSWNLGKQETDLPHLDKIIKKEVPHGFKIRDRKLRHWDDTNADREFGKHLLKRLIDKLGLDESTVMKAIGTLGGGNHFIELGTDDLGNNWLTIHSGSRNFGLQVATYFQKKAKEYCSKKGLHVERDLEYLPLDEGGNEYLDAMEIAQKYAHHNRIEMARAILENFGIDISDLEHIFSVHNYIDLEKNIIRKGAISAKKNEQMLIPFNMRDGIAVATGKGNKEWNISAPHGAGRIYSRSKAKKVLNIQDFKNDMKGIYSTCVSQSTIDESPAAYKDMNLILDSIKPTAEVNFLIKPVYNFKAS